MTPEPPAVSVLLAHQEFFSTFLLVNSLILPSFNRKEVPSGQRLVGHAPVEWSKLPAIYAVDRVVRPLPLFHIKLLDSSFYLGGVPLRILCASAAKKSAKCSHCVAGHHKCEDLLVDKDGKIKPAARAVAAASLRVSQGDEVPEYEDLATKYNLLARREAKRRSPAAAGSASAGGAVVSTNALAELMRRQTEILLDIRAELSALRERTGAGTPPVEDSDMDEDDYGFDPTVNRQVGE
ncbi:uncharacterized protein Triagg1_5192 [Trichoderma aggressivum f. europaeum]|uniref:Uncharacterized protein n=1 Tax=Trichoderma aggressivum f. europaeum TaxID=173218 RepID=A0AAE1ID76_9HYPO|nr:hypothetical protein Triagg1_5192 [Trichoderma aggressivum f. europaeum]